MQVYFDSKTWGELTKFSEGLIGTEFKTSICLPNTEKCKNERFSHYPWSNTHSPQRIYYLLYGVRQFEQYNDAFLLIVETDAKNIVLDTKLQFGYDRANFSYRGVLPYYSYFGNLKVFYFILKEYLKINKLNFDEAVSLIDRSGLEFLPKLSSVSQRTYRNPKYPEGDSFEASSIEARAGFNLNPNWPDYIKVSQKYDGSPILEYSNNSSYWTNDASVR